MFIQKNDYSNFYSRGTCNSCSQYTKVFAIIFAISKCLLQSTIIITGNERFLNDILHIIISFLNASSSKFYHVHLDSIKQFKITIFSKSIVKFYSNFSTFIIIVNVQFLTFQRENFKINRSIQFIEFSVVLIIICILILNLLSYLCTFSVFKLNLFQFESFENVSFALNYVLLLISFAGRTYCLLEISNC